jgi:hypothetical protein
MLCKSRDIALEIEKIMQQIYMNLGIDFKTYVTRLNKKGITIR